MNQTPPSPTGKLLDELKSAAVALGNQSDALSARITDINEELKKANLGISGWVLIQKFTDYQVHFGYCRLAGKWGLAIKREELPELKAETWPFNEAPRWMRVVCVTKLDGLLTHLIESAKKMQEDILQATVKLENWLGSK